MKPNPTNDVTSRIVDGIEYVTLKEATRRCKQYAADNPGTKFACNHAAYKEVRRETTEEEREAMRARTGGCCFLTKTVFGFHKVWAHDAALKANPELRGWFKQVA